MKYVLATAIAFVLSMSTASAQDEAERCGDLPPAVAKTSQAIHAAAVARDYDALGKLAGPGEFIYSFGDEGGDPVAFWKSVDDEGTDIRAVIAAVIEMGCAVAVYEEATEYVYPAAAEIAYADLTADEKAALEKLYPGEVEAQYIEGTEVGYYVGWRLYIDEDGRWSSFIAGD